MVNFKIGDVVIVLDSAKEVGYLGPRVVRISDLEELQFNVGCRVHFYGTSQTCRTTHLIPATPLNEALL